MSTGNPYLAQVVEVGEPVLMRVGFSEAAVAYGIAGEKHWCKLTEGGRMAKVAAGPGPERFVGIFTAGELGFYRDDRDGTFYCYAELAD